MAALVRGVAVPGGYAFRGLPYAAAPPEKLRWRAPRAPADWKGVRDASDFAPSCPQPATNNPFLPPGAIEEDCLYLNVSTPDLRSRGDGRPVLVWIHGGGLTQDAGRNYDSSKLASDGVVVVTINYRLGALGFLAHPAFASRRDGSTGNYGLMDQQAALRWVKDNIRRFGGDPHNVTIAGQSAGGLSVLAHLVSRDSRGLFDRAIVQSGAFALTQQSLVDAEAFGESFAAKVGCAVQTAKCLRRVPVADLIDPRNFPGAAIPGVVDGKVLTESIGTALAAGRFARVPILNGINHDEQFLFVAGLGLAVSNGTFVLVPAVSAANYQSVIATVLGVPVQRAAAIAAEYPLSAYPAPVVAFSTLVSDASFACPALQVDRWTSTRVPTFAYQFNDDTAPHRLTPPGAFPPIATHGSELHVPLRHAEPAVPWDAQRRPADARREHAHSLGELRRKRQPVIRSSALAILQQQRSCVVAGAAAASGRDELCLEAPLFVLGGWVVGHSSPHPSRPTRAAATTSLPGRPTLRDAPATTADQLTDCATSA